MILALFLQRVLPNTDTEEVAYLKSTLTYNLFNKQLLGTQGICDTHDNESGSNKKLPTESHTPASSREATSGTYLLFVFLDVDPQIQDPKT